jgi:uncharacterized protein YcgL (UPF0745 family)
VALVECGAFLDAVDRRCRTPKDVAAENGKRQVVHTLTLLEMEKAVVGEDLEQVKQVCCVRVN